MLRWIHTGARNDPGRVVRTCGIEQLFRAIFGADRKSGGPSSFEPVAQFTARPSVDGPGFRVTMEQIAPRDRAVQKRLASRGLRAERVDDSIRHTGGDDSAIGITTGKVGIEMVVVVG